MSALFDLFPKTRAEILRLLFETGGQKIPHARPGPPRWTQPGRPPEGTHLALLMAEQKIMRAISAGTNSDLSVRFAVVAYRDKGERGT